MSGQAHTLVIGHRGASGYRPEHTSAAYDLAFRLGADAVEPDVIPTRDGVLVIRHENEISGTTDVADRAEFASRRTTKEIDGKVITGWFTEDFTWAELATLRAKERLGRIRPLSATFDGRYPILRLSDLLEIAGNHEALAGERGGIVAEIKHASYFDSIGLPLDELFEAELKAAGWWNDPALVVESFEKTVLRNLYKRGYRSKRIYLVEVHGAPADRVASQGSAAALYSTDYDEAGMRALAASAVEDCVEGISVETTMFLADDGQGDAARTGQFVVNANAAGLEAYCWTLRPENLFLPRHLRDGDDDATIGDWRQPFEIIMDAGFDAIFADHPDLAVAVRNELAQSR